jgi:purine-binding chemotaxis protein CheW
MNQIVEMEGSRDVGAVSKEGLEDFVTFVIQDQLFGIPVLRVQDILTTDKIASIPLAPPEVKGSINLRGRIVTVIDVRVRLGLDKRESGDKGMGVTVEQQNELYTLLVDKVGDVIGLSSDLREDNPSTLDPLWREFTVGIYRLEKDLMVVLDVDRLLDLNSQGAIKQN